MFDPIGVKSPMFCLVLGGGGLGVRTCVLDLIGVELAVFWLDDGGFCLGLGGGGLGVRSPMFDRLKVKSAVFCVGLDGGGLGV